MVTIGWSLGQAGRYTASCVDALVQEDNLSIMEGVSALNIPVGDDINSQNNFVNVLLNFAFRNKLTVSSDSCLSCKKIVQLQ